MSDQVEESILVLGSALADRTRVKALLTESGLRVTERGEGRPDRAPRATIVCHRRSAKDPHPALDGLELGGRVVVLSDRTDEASVVAALEGGAHHYFDITEPSALLRARLDAALRSHARRGQREMLVPPFRFDPLKRRVFRDGHPLALSPKEFELAFYLFCHRGHTVDNRELMTAVWSLPPTMDSRRIDTAACRIRKKMGLERGDRWQLRRLRGSGYVLLERESEPA